MVKLETPRVGRYFRARQKPIAPAEAEAAETLFLKRVWIVG